MPKQTVKTFTVTLSEMTLNAYHRLTLAVACLALLSCVGPVRHDLSTDFPAAVLQTVKTPPPTDGRARFREIFCRLLPADPDYRDLAGGCERFLWRLADEPPPVDPLPSLSGFNRRYRVWVVPGFLNECFAGIALPFEDAFPVLTERGVRIETMMVSGRSSSEANARYLAEAIDNADLDEDERLVLVGHSKGVVDSLHLVADHPRAARRIAAVVSVAGAVNGSPLVDQLDDIYFDLARAAVTGRCDTGDDGALESLRPAVRMSWLAAHPLPPSVRYFSLATFTGRGQINRLLKTGYDHLWIKSPRNDGLLLSTDQLIPGGTLLGYANADHWSVALPLEDRHRLISETVQATERFPRRVLLEALLVYTTEALASEGE